LEAAEPILGQVDAIMEADIAVKEVVEISGFNVTEFLV